MDMRFGTWNLRSPYRTGLLTTVLKELSKYKLDLVGIQEVRWGNEPAGKYAFLYGKRNEYCVFGEVFWHKNFKSAVKRVESVSDRMSYIIRRGCWCDRLLVGKPKRKRQLERRG
jgi:hypothetical protein